MVIDKAEKLTQELIQIRPNWFVEDKVGDPNESIIHNGVPMTVSAIPVETWAAEDVNAWSRVHPRFEDCDGCIIDLGCLGWNKDFEDKTSDNWSGYFLNEKRVIGVDPQEKPNDKADFFKGFISDFSGKADLNLKVNSAHKASMIKSPTGAYEVLTWKDFKRQFEIDSVAILKINIEGAEWKLIESFDSEDFKSIDQICISFHDFLPHFNDQKENTELCINKIIENGYHMIDLKKYGWRLFIKDDEL